MPTYTYKCNECEHQFEIVQKMTDDKLVECPECKEPALGKVIVASGIVLKGSGWTGKIG